MDLKANTHAAEDTLSDVELGCAVTNGSGSSLLYAVITREIDRCLAPCGQCTGVYVDNISGDILRIICRHQCHSKEGRKLAVTKDDRHRYSARNDYDITTAMKSKR